MWGKTRGGSSPLSPTIRQAMLVHDKPKNMQDDYSQQFEEKIKSRDKRKNNEKKMKISGKKIFELQRIIKSKSKKEDNQNE